jgi:hypothetical protein
MSDNENKMRNTFNDSGMVNSGKKRGKDNVNVMRVNANGSNSNPNLLDPSALNKGKGGRRIVRNRSDGMNDSDNENDYIVGPESSHSKIKKRPAGNQRSS